MKKNKVISFFAAMFAVLAMCLMIQAPVDAATVIEPTLLTTQLQTEDAKETTYNFTVPAEEQKIIVPLEVTKKGKVYFKVETDYKAANLNLNLFTDPECAAPVTRGYIYVTGEYSDHELHLKAGTYYLRIIKYTDEGTTPTAANLTLSTYAYSGEDTVLTSGQWVAATGYYDTDTAAFVYPYHQIKVSKKGYLVIEGQDSDGDNLSLTLCNSDKEEYKKVYITSKSGKKVYVPVEKGTYYLRSMTTSPHQFKVTVKKAPASLNNYRIDKAASIKKGKTVFEIVYVGDKKKTYTRWYKITLTKKQKVKFTEYNGTVNLYTNKGKCVSVHEEDGKMVTDKALKKGTYYFRYTASFTKEDKAGKMGNVIRFKWN